MPHTFCWWEYFLFYKAFYFGKKLHQREVARTVSWTLETPSPISPIISKYYAICFYLSISNWVTDIMSSADKESVCNAGNTSLIPRLFWCWGSIPGEGKGYSLQCSWASLVAQWEKNLPAMQETWVRSLNWEDPLEEGLATHSSILVWRIAMDRGAWQLQSMGSQRIRHDWVTKHTSTHISINIET